MSLPSLYMVLYNIYIVLGGSDIISPQWRDQYKRPKTVFKFKGHDWFLYSNTSVRVPGKKNPQPVQKCLGWVCERGLFANVEVMVDQREIRTWEYGFTHAVKALFPEAAWLYEWDEETNRRIFNRMVAARSPETILLETDSSCLEMRKELADAMALCFEEFSGVRFESLEMLKTIRLIDLAQSVSLVTSVMSNVLCFPVWERRCHESVESKGIKT